MSEYNENAGRHHSNKSASEISEKEKGERALFTLKAIAQGSGSNPRVYAQNTLNSLGIKY